MLQKIQQVRQGQDVWCSSYAILPVFLDASCPDPPVRTTSVGTSAKAPAPKIEYSGQSDWVLAGGLRTLWGRHFCRRVTVCVFAWGDRFAVNKITERHDIQSTQYAVGECLWTLDWIPPGVIVSRDLACGILPLDEARDAVLKEVSATTRDLFTSSDITICI